MFLQARTDELRIQKRFLNDMFARVKQEYLERRLRQQQIEQMLGHKGNLAALPSTSAEEAGPSNALALRPADSSALADQADASPGQGNFSYAFCRHWEILPLCSQSLLCLRRCAEPVLAPQCAWHGVHVQLINRALQLTPSNVCLAQCLHLNLQCMLADAWQMVTHAQNPVFAYCLGRKPSTRCHRLTAVSSMLLRLS